MRNMANLIFPPSGNSSWNLLTWGLLRFNTFRHVITKMTCIVHKLIENIWFIGEYVMAGSRNYLQIEFRFRVSFQFNRNSFEQFFVVPERSRNSKHAHFSLNPMTIYQSTIVIRRELWLVFPPSHHAFDSALDALPNRNRTSLRGMHFRHWKVRDDKNVNTNIKSLAKCQQNKVTPVLRRQLGVALMYVLCHYVVVAFYIMMLCDLLKFP